MKEKKNTKYIFINTFYILSVISLIFFVSQIYINQLLPIGYRTITMLVLILIHFVIGIVLMKTEYKKIRHIVLLVFLILLFLVQTVAGFYIYRTYTSYNRRFNENQTKKVVYSLITLKTNDKVDNVIDMNDATVYYDNHEPKEDIDLFKEKTDELNDKLKYEEKDNTIKMAQELLDGDIEYMLLNESKLSLIQSAISEFDKAYKVVKIFLEDNDKLEVEKEPVVNKKEVESGQSFNILISGGDSYGGLDEDLRSDVNILLSVNPSENKLLLTQIPRDSYVFMRDLGEDKLTHAGTYGIDTLMGTVEDLLETDINYYVKVNFDSLEDIVDALGGITVQNDVEFYSMTKKLYFPVGKLDLDGEYALEFVRERYSLPNGEFDRGQNQLKVLKAMIEKAISPSIIFNYTTVLDEVLDSIFTNIPSSKVTELINDQIESLSAWNIVTDQVEGYPVSGLYSYTMPDYDLSFVQLYEEEIYEAINNIRQVLGENVEETDVEIDDTDVETDNTDEAEEYYYE